MVIIVKDIESLVQPHHSVRYKDASATVPAPSEHAVWREGYNTGFCWDCSLVDCDANNWLWFPLGPSQGFES